MTPSELCARLTVLMCGVGYNAGVFTTRRATGAVRRLDEPGLKDMVAATWYRHMQQPALSFDYVAVRAFLVTVAPDEGGQIG